MAARVVVVNRVRGRVAFCQGQHSKRQRILIFGGKQLRVRDGLLKELGHQQR